MITVIIPAHNEESVIERCLSALVTGAEPGELEVIVACNGCSDRTAQRARVFGESAHGVEITVLELTEASKTAAINAAEHVASGFPRLYVDADVVLPLASAREIAAALERNGHLLASPVAETDTSSSSKAVKAFYDLWLRLPYNQVMVGTGVYALSEEGRRRFGEFPPIIADDGFVRSRFTPAERLAVSDACVTVTAPRTLSDLIRVKTRSRLGGYEVARKYPRPDTADPKNPWAIVKSLPWGFGLPIRVMVYLFVNVIVRFRARRLFSDVAEYRWERDETTRRAAAVTVKDE